MDRGKFKGVLLISDYDDTLYGSSLHISQEDRSAILSFMEQGGLFTVATGRARSTFSPQVEKEDIPLNAPVILSNGATILDCRTEELVRRTYLPDRVIEDMAQLCRVFPELGFEAYHQNEIFVHNPNFVTHMHMKRVGMDYTILPIPQLPTPLTKIILEQDAPMLQQVQTYLLERAGESYEVIFSNRYLLELTAKGSHKGGSALWLADHLGISREHLYCVGDNQNDLPMLEVARIGFAPANCNHLVKEWGARIVNSCDDGCVASVIRILDELYETRPSCGAKGAL